MNVIDIYFDVKDAINTSENGVLTFETFNRFSKQGERRFLDFLTGDVENTRAPAPYLSQKNKDWLSFLIEEYPSVAVGGVLTKPKDYYQFENLYAVRGERENCDEDIKIETNSVELLGGSQFNERLSTDIEELKVERKPIAKLTAKGFVFAPKDIGNAVLEYIRYPKYGRIATKLDEEFNELVPDPSKSQDYEWGDYAAEILKWFIVDSYANRNRDQSLKSFNSATGKLARDQKS